MTTPALPPTLLTDILPHLLPPSPLPQELLSKSLLQRLLYLPPSPSDLDAHLSPFPSSEDQPVSSRLRELARGHKWGVAEYTREGEEVFARMVVEKEEGGDGVEVWFEYEGEVAGGQGRGWVYHSARVQVARGGLVGDKGDEQQWVSSPSALPPAELPSPDSPSAAEDADPLAAPADYWAAFDDAEGEKHTQTSLPSYPNGNGHAHTNGHSIHFDLPPSPGFEAQAAEDAYWAMYSRPATAPITPGIRTPGAPLAHSDSNPGPDGHSLTNGHVTAPGPAPFHPHNAHPQSSLETYFHPTTKAPAHLDPTAAKLHESLAQLGLAQSQALANGAAVMDLAPRGIWRETSEDVRARVRGKIGSGLNSLWTGFAAGAEGEEREEKAMEWLRVARGVMDPSASPVLAGSSAGGWGGAGGVSTEVLKAKLEVMVDMYEVLNEEEEVQGLWRMVEGVIKRGAVEQEEDEVTRQQMYYE
ncbi:hypothetical protein IAT38_008340 [Cryptococcus sp. DSM 104549]